MLTQKKVSEALDVGEPIFVLVGNHVKGTIVTAIEKTGIDTEFDFFPYEEHGETWWLTKGAATHCLEKNGR